MPVNHARYDAIDALRGFAMVWMTLFHFCFDLNHFGHIKQDFYSDPIWTWQRTCILSMFLFTAGLSQAIALHQGQNWPRFWRRWGQVAGCAMLVTAGSYVMYPQSFIYFGTLHGIAVMLVVVRLTAGCGRWLWVLGGLAIAIKYGAAYALSTRPVVEYSQIFNSPALNWLGWITQKPRTEDYVPLFPWLGVMWWGMAAGQWVLARRSDWMGKSNIESGSKSNKRNNSTDEKKPAVLKPLAFLGRWSLSYYLLHQPVMIGALMLTGLLAK